MRASELVLDVLLPCAAGAQALALAGDAPQPAPLHDPSAEAWVLPVRLSCLQQLSSVRLWLPDEVSSLESRRRGHRLLVGIWLNCIVSHAVGKSEVCLMCQGL